MALLIPLMVGLYALAYLLRPVPQQLKQEGRVFEDPSTGALFETSEGQQPERDKNVGRRTAAAGCGLAGQPGGTGQRAWAAAAGGRRPAARAAARADSAAARPPQGELAFRPYSYTCFPVEAGYEGERVRIDVGPVKDRQPR